MDKDSSTAKELLEGPDGHFGHLPGLSEGQLALLEQIDSKFSPQLLWCHPGGMNNIAWYFD
jgi:hypothetical protein